ncbi:hypothetical protein IscW_ISCW002901 [Ixodes scapularis]|uniref:Uncharacterized protein n=1 Tax=Ixodes scapularis TaxID=6945 RepID=B7P7W7_IXOSC|nr:hypothetical protein IscW_ISCW002901 [Ixodes scapularis]|eukprot:XP_002400050.1 hypothetical protein IscW_ISCW002901 [Ixodes scapularis]
MKRVIKRKRYVWYVRGGRGVRSPFTTTDEDYRKQNSAGSCLGTSGLFSRAKCNIPQARVKFAQPFIFSCRQMNKNKKSKSIKYSIFQYKKTS